jgi:hypothetical protein
MKVHFSEYRSCIVWFRWTLAERLAKVPSMGKRATEITRTELIRRINRALVPFRAAVKWTPFRGVDGRAYLIDLTSRRVLDANLDLELAGRSMHVLAEWERLAIMEP